MHFLVFLPAMAIEHGFRHAHHPDVLHTKSRKELFRDVIEAEYNGVRHHLVDYLSAYLKACGYKLKVVNGEVPNSDKPLLLALNHHSRQRFFTTEESLRAVAIASVSAREYGITSKPIAWMIRELPVPPVGIGKMARQVQNATGIVFDSIPAKTVKKLSFKGFVPRYRETMTPEDANSLITRVVDRVQSGNALGVFPEQEPTFELRPYHRNFTRTLDTLKLLTPEYQISTMACFYEGNTAFAVYGPVIDVRQDSPAAETATLVMKGIASGMPRNLRGAYV